MKKYLIRALLIFAALVFAFSVLTGCGDSSGSSKGEEEIASSSENGAEATAQPETSDHPDTSPESEKAEETSAETGKAEEIAPDTEKTEETEKQPETSAAQPIEEPKAELKVETAAHFSKKAVPFYDYNQDLDLVMDIDIPKLLPETDTVKALNAQMYDFGKAALEELKENKEEDRLYNVGYSYGIADDLAAIIIRKSEGVQASEWYTSYSCNYYDAKNDRVLTFDNYLSLLGTDRDAMYNVFKLTPEFEQYRSAAEFWEDPNVNPNSSENLYAFAYSKTDTSYYVIKAAEGMYLFFEIDVPNFQ